MKEYKIVIEGWEKSAFIKAENLHQIKHFRVRDAIYLIGAKAPFGEQKQVKLKVYSQDVEKGVIVEKFVGEFSAFLPEESPNEDQFREKMDAILSFLPKEFRSFIEAYAWDKGHSSGYCEIMSIAQELTDNLREAVNKFYRRLTSQN